MIAGNTAKKVNIAYFTLGIAPNDSNFEDNYWDEINPGSLNWTDDFVTNGVCESPKIWHVLPSTTINASDLTRGYNSAYDFIATFTDRLGNGLKNVQVSFKIGDEIYNGTTDSDGVCKLTLKLNVGKYDITSINPVTLEEKTNQVNIVKRIISNKDLTKDYLDSAKYKILIIGDDGKHVGKGVSVKVTLKGSTSTLKTDANGYITKAIDLTAGKYTISATYKGFKVSNKITIKPILKSKNVNVKVKRPITVTATLKHSNGKAIANKKITFKFKGKTLTGKTNSKGIAKVTFKNTYKAGKYQVQIKYVKQTIKQNIVIKK